MRRFEMGPPAERPMLMTRSPARSGTPWLAVGLRIDLESKGKKDEKMMSPWHGTHGWVGWGGFWPVDGLISSMHGPLSLNRMSERMNAPAACRPRSTDHIYARSNLSGGGTNPHNRGHNFFCCLSWGPGCD